MPEHHRVQESEMYPVYHLTEDRGPEVELPDGFKQRYDAAWAEWLDMQEVIEKALPERWSSVT